MRIDKNQKITIIAGVIIIIAAFIIWQVTGGEIWTKTSVLVEKKDPLFGSTYKEWKDQFIFGLDITLAITGFVIVASGILLYIFNKKRKKNEIAK